MKLTIGEIARQANVSKGTVSRVINEKTTVAAETRERVLEVMTRLGYQPDPVARELSMRSKHTLGIWVGAGENRLSPYFSVVWRALLREMQIRATQFVELPVEITPLRRRFDAVLLFRCANLENRLAALKAMDVPAVLIGHHPGVACVAPDDPGGGRLAAAHLLDLGHRRLLHLTVAEDLQWAHERADGFTAVVGESGPADATIDILRGVGSVLGGYRLMRDAWLQGYRPTGVFCATDEMAVGALGALADFGVSVPGEVSVVGFDGLTELFPGLASVAQNISGIAHQAVSLALAAIDHPVLTQTIVPVAFINGATLGPAPGPPRTARPRARARQATTRPNPHPQENHDEAD